MPYTTDDKLFNKMNKFEQEKLIEYRNNDKVTIIELSKNTIHNMYCMQCFELFNKQTSIEENWGIIDGNTDILHCCSECHQCHSNDDAWYCKYCKECHAGSENDLALTYKRCPKCKKCIELSLYERTNIECEYCNHTFNMSDCYD